MGQLSGTDPGPTRPGPRGGRLPPGRDADHGPASSADLVARPRLLDALDAGRDARVTLITGPPGSGKTVLLSDWMASDGPGDHARMLSLDASDRTLSGLWARLADALDLTGEAAVAPATPAAVAQRVLDAAGSPGLVLALDDVHLADSAATRETLTALVLAPAGPRLILSSRVDPGVALQRLRLAGELVEIRGADLAFTLPEAAELLARDGTILDPQVLRRLWERTEGWGAGLRLAALSLNGHPDAAAFVEDFAGDDRAVVAYLIEEVLERRSDAARELLLATAVVEQVSAPLANALTGRDDAAAILDDLVRSNAFIVPLDRRGEWFRYHALFADLLRSQLGRRGRDAVRRQHGRAARWFAAQGRPAEALRHAVLAEEWDAATAIMADDWLGLRGDDGGAPLDDALAAFPEAALRARPYAELIAAMRSCDHDDDARAEAHLLTASRARHKLGGARRGAFIRDLSLVRLLRAARDGDAEAGLRELPLVASLDHLLSAHGREAGAVAHLELGRLHAACGDDDAEHHLRLAGSLAAEAERPVLVAEASAERSWLYALDGDLRAARLAIDAAATIIRGPLALPIPALLASALAAAQTGDLRRAAEQRDEARARLAAEPAEAGRLRVLGLELVGAQLALLGAPAEADGAADRLEHELRGWHPPRRLEAEALAALAALLVRGDRPDEALRLLPDAGVECDGALAVARGTALLALGDSEVALVDGERLSAAGDLPLPLAIAATTLAAVAAEAEGDRAAAQRHAERALDLAEPEGVRLPLAVAADDLEPVLQRLLRFGTAHRSLIGEVLELARSGSAPAAAGVAPLDEPLSDRELTVLRYLPTLLSSTEIAGELFVTVNTVKSHLKSVYRKLGVSNRREAVQRARDLGLIAVSGLSLERRPALPITHAGDAA
jgi:LuxR family maltose regulon positive regulatory protein